MAVKKPTERVYLIQKIVVAHTLLEALQNEAKGQIVEVTLTNHGRKKLEPAIGFMLDPQISVTPDDE